MDDPLTLPLTTAAGMSRLVATLAALLLCVAGCRAPSACADRSCVQAELQSRLAGDVAETSAPGEVQIPLGVSLDDGLSEDEAVAVALWNNRDFQATLSNLGIAKGDLVQAGLLTNPQLNLLFPPIGSKQLEWTLYVPLEAMLLRKQRVAIADRDFQRIANEIVQNGLNVARDARLAYADFQFATDRHEFAIETVDLRMKIAELAERRWSAGDISELELQAIRIDANRSRAEEVGLERGIQVSEARLKNALGLATYQARLVPERTELPETSHLQADDLVAEAIEIRPDVKAARIALEAATQRVALARKSFLRIDAVADGNGGGAGPTNAGPGLRFEIPIFNRNQGLVIRSEWTVDQANHNYFSFRDRAETEVRVALGSLEQARENLRLLRRDVLPELQESLQLSEKAYAGGGNGYLLVLQSTSQFLDSRIRQLELEADLRRALAELDRSVGRRVMSSSPPRPLQ